MTFNKPDYSWKLHDHQVILLDENGAIYESCDSIFDTSSLLGISVRTQFHFLDSEFETILNSTASKITFEKMQTQFDLLPGYYDFTFSKQESDGKRFIVWDIYDYTKIYEEYANVQQLQNELEIQKQYNIKRNHSKLSDSFTSYNFFQSDYVSSNKFDTKNILSDFSNSKLDVFNLDANKIDFISEDGKDEELKRCINKSVDRLNKFVERLKNTQETQFNIKQLVNDVLDSKLRNQPDLIIELGYDANVVDNIVVDEILVNQLVNCLFENEQNSLETSNNKLQVGYEFKDPRISFLTFSYSITISSLDAFAATSKCTFIKLAILKSILSMIGGDLNSGFQANNAVFTINMAIPVK